MRPYIGKYVDHIAAVRGIPAAALKGFHDMMIGDVVHGTRSKIAKEWAARQCYIALGNLMTTAAMMNIDACPMEGLDNDQYDEILGLKGTGYTTIVACAVGYRSENDVFV